MIVLSKYFRTLATALVVSLLPISAAFAEEVPGPAEVLVVVHPDGLTVSIIAPLANYGVAPGDPVAPGRAGVPENDVYDRIEADISESLNSAIDDIELSAASKLAVDQEARCEYAAGNLSIFEGANHWTVELEVDLDCFRMDQASRISINFMDLPLFMEATVTVLNDDVDDIYEIDGVDRSVPLYE